MALNKRAEAIDQACDTDQARTTASPSTGSMQQVATLIFRTSDRPQYFVPFPDPSP